MIIYKPTKKVFRNRKEAKLAFGHYNYNKLIKTTPDDFILTNDSNIIANYEYFYTNPIEPSKPQIKK